MRLTHVMHYNGNDVTATHKTTYPAILGQVIEEKRKKLGLGQGDLARALGISQPSWSRIEKGLSIINAEQLNIVAKTLQEEPHTLLADVDQSQRLLSESGVDVMQTKDVKQPKQESALGPILFGAALAGFILALVSKK